MRKCFFRLWTLKDLLFVLLIVMVECLFFTGKVTMGRQAFILCQVGIAGIIAVNTAGSILFYRGPGKKYMTAPVERPLGEGNVFERFDSLLMETSKSGSDEFAAQALRTQAEIHALQNQINPHFLYNTLDIIRSQAISYNVPDIEKLTEALALLFRYSISSPAEQVTLRDEINNVEKYVLIQQYRFRNRFSYEKVIESSDLLDFQLPLLTLQPIFENAIHHGLEHRLEKGKLTLRVFGTEKNIIIRVEDTGTGMDIQTLHILRERISSRPAAVNSDSVSGSSGIGLYNVNQRIKLYFGDDYGLHITSIKDSGTVVEIRLPKIAKTADQGEVNEKRNRSG